MGKQAPETPDYVGAARETSASNERLAERQTVANRPNQTNAFGASSTFTRNEDGSWNQNQSFGGQLGALSQQLQGQAFDAMSNPLSFGGVPAAIDGSVARDQAINAAYGQATSRLNPQWQARDQQMASQLASQGLDPNSQAYRTAMMAHGQQRNDAYTSAMNGAIGQGTQAGDTLFRNSMMSRQQALSELLRQRQAPLDALSSLGAFTNQGQFQGAQRVQGPDSLAAAMAQGQGQLNAWNAQNQANADLWGGLIQAGGTIASVAASDRRVKRNIVPLEREALPGVPFYEYEYEWEPGVRRTGVMAQDLEKVSPRHVLENADGIKFVDYSFLSEVDRG